MPSLDAALERIVGAAWHAALGAPPAGADEDFFAAGGHSLVATELAVRLSQVLGIEVPLTMVFDFPTVRGQTVWLGANVQGGATACEPWRPGVTKRVLAVRGPITPAALEDAILVAAEQRGIVALGASIDLVGVRGAARRDAWARVTRSRPGDAAWCATVVRFAPERHLIALGFDGDRLDAASADQIVAEIIAAHARGARPSGDRAATQLVTELDDHVDASPWQVHAAPPRVARILGAVAHQQSTSVEASLAALAAAALVATGERRAGDRIVVGVPSLRGGFGANTTLAPLALDTGGDPSFVTLVDHARDALLEGWAASAGVSPPATPNMTDLAAIAEVRHATSRVDSGGIAWRCAARPVPSPGRVHVIATYTRSGALVMRVSAPGDARTFAAGLERLFAKIARQPNIALSRAMPEVPGILRDEHDGGAPAAPHVAAASVAPLTHAQERLWFVEALTPSTSTNHIQRVYRVDGPLDVELVHRALHALAARHPSLRTVFRASGGVVEQVVHAELPVEHRVDRVDDLAAVIELARTDHMRPFDLEVGPLWRTRVCMIGERLNYLILTIHHLIVDALSVIVWLRELAEHYHVLATKNVPRLSKLATSIAEIAAWERSPAGRARGDADLAFWRDRLDGVRPLELPIDARRPRGHGVGRHEVHEIMSPERGAELRALGRRRGATLNVTLFAAAAAFLSRLTGQTDLVCVLPAARRDDPGREAVIGLLLNLLPVRIRLDGDPSFAEIISRANRAVRESIAHAESPYDRIVAALGLPREPGRQPLLDVIVNMVPGTETTRRADLHFTIETALNSAQPCDLVVGALTRPGGLLDLMIRARDDLFAEVTVQRMIQRFVTLLRAAVATPTLPLSELPLMPETERTLTTVTWNATELALPEATVHDLVGAQLTRSPDAIAIVQGTRSMSAGELDVRSRRLADHLKTRQVPPHARVGVAIPSSPELAVAALAVMRAGMTYVPIDAAQPASRVADLAREVAFVVEPSELAASEHAEPAPGVVCRPDDPAYVVFTSGSTGRPKSVTTSHRALVNQIAWFRTALPWRAGEVSCLRSSPAFVDSLWELFGPLADGVPLAIATSEEMLDARGLAAMIARHDVTRIVIVPSLLRTLLELRVSPRLDLWLATSEELTPSLVRAFRAARPRDRLVNLYGASETADQVAAYEVVAPDPLRTPIGRPIANSRVYVVDELGLPAPIGVAGELCIAGVGVSGSVIAGGAANAFVAGERVYRSGDRGRWRHDGELEYIGRIDHVLKIRGVRVDPGEVEAALLDRPEIAAAVVTAQPGLNDEPRLVAHVVPRQAVRIDASELRRRLRDRLPEPLIPTSFVVLDALPLGPTGKIDRAMLPASPPVAPSTSRAPNGATEHAVALAWEPVLGRPVGAEDDFFAAGGESLLAALLGARLAERFGVEPPLAMLFERPTIAAQAAWLDDATRLAGGRHDDPAHAAGRGDAAVVRARAAVVRDAAHAGCAGAEVAIGAAHRGAARRCTARGRARIGRRASGGVAHGLRPDRRRGSPARARARATRSPRLRSLRRRSIPRRRDRLRAHRRRTRAAVRSRSRPVVAHAAVAVRARRPRPRDRDAPPDHRRNLAGPVARRASRALRRGWPRDRSAAARGKRDRCRRLAAACRRRGSLASILARHARGRDLDRAAARRAAHGLAGRCERTRARRARREPGRRPRDARASRGYDGVRHAARRHRGVATRADRARRPRDRHDRRRPRPSRGASADRAVPEPAAAADRCQRRSQPARARAPRRRDDARRARARRGAVRANRRRRQPAAATVPPAPVRRRAQPPSHRGPAALGRSRGAPRPRRDRAGRAVRADGPHDRAPRHHDPARLPARAVRRTHRRGLARALSRDLARNGRVARAHAVVDQVNLRRPALARDRRRVARSDVDVGEQPAVGRVANVDAIEW